mmetsp:Transcript_6717/g.7329  ORF Transcript_6717/g.7329 Transcript_6717/m.7329 type:complete len:357 (+) Transcript_6717:170-1240(+)
MSQEVSQMEVDKLAKDLHLKMTEEGARHDRQRIRNRRKSMVPQFTNSPHKWRHDEKEAEKLLKTPENPIEAIVRMRQIMRTNTIPEDLPTFSGEAHENIDEWLHQMALHCKVNQWSEDEYILALGKNLRQGALQAWGELSPEDMKNPESVIGCLLEAYGTVGDRSDRLLENFENAQQGSLTVQNYYHKLKHLARIANLDLKLGANAQWFIRIFRKGLNSNIRTSIDHKDFNTIEGLLHVAKMKEKKLRQKAHNTVNSLQTAEIAELVIAAIQSRYKPTQQENSDRRRCFICGKPNHLAKNCYYNNKNQNRTPKRRFKGKCSYCGIQGHTEANCYKKHPEKRPNRRPRGKGGRNTKN